jgi:transcription termination/antitermination protein NusG
VIFRSFPEVPECLACRLGQRHWACIPPSDRRDPHIDRPTARVRHDWKTTRSNEALNYMPLLAAEPVRFPDGLLTDPDALADRRGRWWVVHTKARGEKALARHLFGRSVSYYLPLHRNTWKNNGRTFTSHLPLFPGYVFVYGDEDDRVAALESNQVSRLLPVTDQDRMVSDLRRVDRMLAADAPVAPADAMAPGQPVRIVAGLFEGLTGTLVHQGGQLRLVVEVDFLKQAVSVEVEGWTVEPVGQHTTVGCAH